MVQVTMMNLNGWVETSTKLAQTTPERRNKTYITQRRRAKKRRIFRRENTWAFDKPVKQDWNTSGKFLAWLHKSKERQNTHRTQQLPVLLWGGSRDREGTCSRKADIRHSKDSCLEEQKKKNWRADSDGHAHEHSEEQVLEQPEEKGQHTSGELHVLS